jgi:UDP-N-acetylmuramate dehydrogenase
MHPGIVGIRSRLTLPFREGEPLARWTTFGVGGPADLWVEPRNFRELSRMLELAGKEGLPWVVLGRGANILAADEGFRGIVIHLSGDFRRVVLRPPFLFAGAGAALGRAVWLGMEAGLGGWEKLLAVPSSVGGALIMNAGCYGQEICEVLDWVLVTDFQGRTHHLPARELSFGYRSSPLRGMGVICWAGFKLEKAGRGNLQKTAREVVEKRRVNLPPGKSAGSVFKNPPGHKARELIGSCGLGGATSGGACISTRHPNFILNLGTASAGDILSLIGLAKTRVWKTLGIRLEEEVRTIGFKTSPAVPWP